MNEVKPTAAQEHKVGVPLAKKLVDRVEAHPNWEEAPKRFPDAQVTVASAKRLLDGSRAFTAELAREADKVVDELAIVLYRVLPHAARP